MTKTEAKNVKSDNGDECILTLVHRDKGRYAAMIPAEEGADEPTYFLFEREIPLSVPPYVFEQLKDLEERVVDGPADVTVPLFRTGKPPPDVFDELPSDTKLTIMQERMDTLTGEVQEVVSLVKTLVTGVDGEPPVIQGGGVSPEVQALEARQGQLEAGQEQLTDTLAELVTLVKSQAKPRRRKPAKKRRARKPKAMVAAQEQVENEAGATT